MCGRFVATKSAEQVSEFFGAVASAPSPVPNFNVAPTTDVLAVVEGGEGRRVESFRWGLVPSWAKDVSIGSRMINARAETIAEKPSFKGRFRKHRLLVPMDGFYEWKAGPNGKVPMFIHRADGTPLAVAGLWATWKDPSGSPDEGWLHSCTVITTAANHLMSPVHDRMPAVLEPGDWEEWLDPHQHDPVLLQHLLRPAAENVLTMHAVSTKVNNVRNKGAELIDPVGAD